MAPVRGRVFIIPSLEGQNGLVCGHMPKEEEEGVCVPKTTRVKKGTISFGSVGSKAGHKRAIAGERGLFLTRSREEVICRRSNVT